MQKYFTIFILTMISLIGCSSEDLEEVPHFLEVELTVNPEQANPNEPILMEAKVTYGDENVTDADDVTFEIRRVDSEEKPEKIKVKHSENGIYRLEKSFPVEGTYYVISHVTARDMHNMPKKEFIVGEPSTSEENSNSSNSEHGDDDESSSH